LSPPLFYFYKCSKKKAYVFLIILVSQQRPYFRFVRLTNTMKNQLLLLVLCLTAMSLVSSVSSKSTAAKRFIKKSKPKISCGKIASRMEQRNNIENLKSFIKETGLKLNRELKISSPPSVLIRRSESTKRRVFKTIAIFKVSIRCTLEQFGLKFLIKKLRGAKAQLMEKKKGKSGTTGPCFPVDVYNLVCILFDGSESYCLKYIWIEGVILSCPW